MRVNLKNPNTHQLKQAKVGFSWTTFFFGFLVALFRGDWKWFGIQLGIGIILGCLTHGVGAAISAVTFAFCYNKLYINDLLKAGYVPNDKASKDVLLNKGITVANN